MAYNQQLLTILEDLEIADNAVWMSDNFVQTWINGVKFELKDMRKGPTLIVAYHPGKPELAQVVKDAFPGYGPNAHGAYYVLDTMEQLVQLAEEVHTFILSEGLVCETGRKTLKTDDQGYFEKTATALKAIVDAEAYDFLTRHTFDQHDELITVGKSRAVLADSTAPTWREHIVPCTVILDEAVRMVQANCTVPQLAQMLKENLAIVVITADEAKHLDSVYQTTMPAGWQFGDNVFARLDAMNIAY